MRQEDGKKWAAAAHSQPTIPKSDRLLDHYLLALQFFTRIPVTGRLARWVGYSPVLLRASAAHFPGVGWIVAGAATLVYAALHLALAPKPWESPVAAAFLWCFVPLALVWWAQSALFLVASCTLSALAATWLAWRFARRPQGYTGD